MKVSWKNWQNNGNRPLRDERRTSYGIMKVPRRLLLRTSCFSKTLKVTCEDESAMLVIDVSRHLLMRINTRMPHNPSRVSVHCKDR